MAFIEAASCMEAEVMGDFPPDTNISRRIVRLDSPIEVAVGDGLVIVRENSRCGSRQRLRRVAASPDRRTEQRFFDTAAVLTACLETA